MFPILAGAGGFLCMVGADWADSRGLSFVRRLGKALAIVLYAPAFFFLIFAEPRFPVPLALRLFGWGLAFVSAWLLFRSLFLELRPPRTAPDTRMLVKQGSYALSRHPGPLWLCAFHAALVLMSGSRLLLLALPVWTAMNILLVSLEDRVFFPLIFGDAYKKYREEVPFLLPTLASLRRYLSVAFPPIPHTRRSSEPRAGGLHHSWEKVDPVASTIELLRQGRTAEIWENYCGYLDFDIKKYMAVQRQLLEEQLAKYSSCELWSTIMKGQKPRTADEFRKMVPLTTYRDYAPFLLPKNEAALPEKTFSWAHTSGRSGEYEAKWIPYSRSMYEHVGDAFLAAFLVSAAKSRGDVVLREGMTFPFVLAPVPYISGIITESMLERFPFKCLPALDRAMSLGFQERIMAAFEDALDEGLDFFWGMTSILMKLGESFGQRSSSSGSAAKKMLKKPKALFRIAKASLKAAMHGRPLMPKDIWKVKGAICGGMDTTILKDKVAELWGIEPMEGYGCTEFGAIAFQSWSREYLTFYPFMNFWEFVTEKDYQAYLKDPSFIPKSLFMDEVKPGAEYVLVGTNFHGGSMIRLILGDLVKIVALEDSRGGIKLPQMTFVSRIDGLIDIGGFTRLTEKTIWQAIENAGIRYEDWSVRKETAGDKPVLKLYIELKDERLSAEAVADKVHGCLKELDAPYRDMEELAALRPLSVTLLTKGSFKRYMEERQAAGADLAHTKPTHVNASDKTIESLIRMSNWKI